MVAIDSVIDDQLLLAFFSRYEAALSMKHDADATGVIGAV